MTPFEEAAHEFIDSRGSERTKAAYRGDLARWLAWCQDAHANPAKPSLAHAAAFRDGLRTSNAQLTIRRILSALSAVYQHCLSKEKPPASWNPFAVRALPRPAEALYQKTQVVSDDDATAILEAAGKDESPLGRRDHAILQILRVTGLRRVSVASLVRERILDRGGPMLLGVIIKGGAEAQVEVTGEVSRALRTWLKVAPPSPWVFPSKKVLGHPIDGTTVNQIVTSRAKKAGVGHVHPHQFRAAFITAALDAGASLNDVQRAVHHQDPRTTQKYDRGARGKGVVEAVARWREAQK